jgi:hypothetical protein
MNHPLAFVKKEAQKRIYKKKEEKEEKEAKWDARLYFICEYLGEFDVVA